MKICFYSTLCQIQAAFLGELVGSQKASDKLLKIYSVFMGVGVLALLRGLVPQSGKASTIGKRPVLARKKRV